MSEQETMKTWALEWYQTRIDGKRAKNTQDGYRNLIEHHIIPKLGSVQLSQLTTRRVCSFYARLGRQGLAHNSVWCVHLLLRRILDEACREGRMDRNPVSKINFIQGEIERKTWVSTEQLNRYLEAVQLRGAYPIFYIGLREWVAFWQKNYDAPVVRHTTYEAHRYVLENHILPWIGDCPLESLTTQKIEKFLEEHRLHGNKRNGKPLSQQTMRHIQNLLSKVLGQAATHGLIERNPVQGICFSAPKKVKATILADHEVRDYLSAAEELGYLGDRFTAVATYTGTATSSYVKGYTVTADYTGTVSRIALNKVRYVAIFEGTPLEPVQPVEEGATPAQFNWLAIAVPFGIVALVGAGTDAALFMKRRHETSEEESE